MNVPTPNSPCYGCTNRCVGCQCECSLYKNWKTEFNKKKERLRSEEKLKYGYHSSHFQNYAPHTLQEFIRKKNKLPGQY